MKELIQEIKKHHKNILIEGNLLILKGNVTYDKLETIKHLWSGDIKIIPLLDSNQPRKKQLLNDTDVISNRHTLLG